VWSACLCRGPDVAGLLVTTLDWAFTGLDAVVRDRDDAVPNCSRGLQTQSDVARALLGARGLGQDRAAAGVILQLGGGDHDTILEIRPGDLPLVVFLKTPNSLLTYTAKRQRDRSTLVDLLTAQNTVEHALSQRENSKSSGTLEVPDLPLDHTAPRDVHVWFDAYVELALAVAEWLMKEHGGPVAGRRARNPSRALAPRLGLLARGKRLCPGCLA
jgi:hypothetical protein